MTTYALVTIGYGLVGAIALPIESAKIGEPTEIGEARRAVAGNLRNGVQAIFNNWTLTTIALDTTTYNNLIALIGPQKTLPCQGDLFLGATVSCQVRITGQTIVGIGETVAGYGFLWQVTLQLAQAV